MEHMLQDLTGEDLGRLALGQGPSCAKKGRAFRLGPTGAEEHSSPPWDLCCPLAPPGLLPPPPLLLRHPRASPAGPPCLDLPCPPPPGGPLLSTVTSTGPGSTSGTIASSTSSGLLHLHVGLGLLQASVALHLLLRPASHIGLALLTGITLHLL